VAAGHYVPYKKILQKIPDSLERGGMLPKKYFRKTKLLQINKGEMKV
jgi:hypothetical protein